MKLAIFRRQLSQMIEFSPQAGLLARTIDVLMIILIILNVLAIMMESVESIHRQYNAEFYVFEVVSVIIFSIEYVFRVWSCPELKEDKYEDNIKGRLKYMMSIPALIDLAAILPFYLAFFFIIDLRFLRVFRLFRVFKLTRYSSAMTTLLKVLRDESSAFFAAFSILIIVLILASSGIYLIEHDIQPEAFGSIPAAMWWATSTLTTVGYGDVTPITPLGRLFGGFITVVGMGMVALPAGILASGFSAQLKQNRDIYHGQLVEALKDGVITQQEHDDLELLRRELGINAHEAKVILFAYQHQQQQQTPPLSTCPHCQGELIHPSASVNISEVVQQHS